MLKEKKKFPINYKGKIYNTTIHHDLTDEEFEACKKEYYTKPDIEDVKDELRKIHLGGVKMGKVVNYFFKYLMAKVHIYYNNWTIEDVFEYKPLMEFFAGKCDVNDKIYPKTNTLCENITTAFRLCGFKTASKPANFPMKAVDDMLENYCHEGGNYYDFSSGWGSRLLSALKHNVNYFGNDPNYLLCEELHKLFKLYKDVNPECKSKFEVHPYGSEEFNPNYVGKMDLAFSSPPYFKLEDYKIGNQSYKEGMEYETWVSTFLRPMIKNIYAYLKDDGYFGINVKDCEACPHIVEDVISIAEEIGFKYIDVMNLKNIHRCHGHKEWKEDDERTDKCGWNNNDEGIYIFKKSLEIY